MTESRDACNAKEERGERASLCVTKVGWFAPQEGAKGAYLIAR
jgi:hypothetical protein